MRRARSTNFLDKDQQPTVDNPIPSIPLQHSPYLTNSIPSIQLQQYSENPSPEPLNAKVGSMTRSLSLFSLQSPTSQLNNAQNGTTSTQQELTPNSNPIFKDFIGVSSSTSAFPTNTTSSNNTSTRELLLAYRHVLRELYRVGVEVEELRREVRGFAEESSQWTLRYTRRLVVISNILMAIYIMVKKGIDIVNYNSRDVLLMMLPSSTMLFWNPIINRFKKFSAASRLLNWVKGNTNTSSLSNNPSPTPMTSSPNSSTISTQGSSSLSSPQTSFQTPKKFYNAQMFHYQQYGLKHPTDASSSRTRKLIDKVKNGLQKYQDLYHQMYPNQKNPAAEAYVPMTVQQQIQSQQQQQQQQQQFFNANSTYLNQRINSFQQNQQQQQQQPQVMNRFKSSTDFQLYLIKVMWKSVVKSSLLIFSSFYLGKRDAWKRNIGLWSTILVNIHIAFTTDISPWLIYFSMFSIASYITSRYFSYTVKLFYNTKWNNRKNIKATVAALMRGKGLGSSHDAPHSQSEPTTPNTTPTFRPNFAMTDDDSDV